MAPRISKEFKIGLFGVLAIAILYLGFNYLKGKDFFKETKKYYAIYENIDGLTVSNSIFVKGLAVGRVSNVLFQQEKGRIVVEMDIDGDLKLSDSTVAFLRSESFLGGKAIELRIPEKIEHPLNEGDTVRSALAMGMLESITQKTLPVAEDVGALIRKFSVILDSLQIIETHVKNTVIELNATLEVTRNTIQDNRENVKFSMEHIRSISVKLDSAAGELKPMLAGANSVIDSLQAANLAETITSLHEAVGNLNLALQKLNQGEGSAGKLFHDDSLYIHLNRSAEDLDKLLVDLRQHPKRYVHFSVFGKKEK